LQGPIIIDVDGHIEVGPSGLMQQQLLAHHPTFENLIVAAYICHRGFAGPKGYRECAKTSCGCVTTFDFSRATCHAGRGRTTSLRRRSPRSRRGGPQVLWTDPGRATAGQLHLILHPHLRNDLAVDPSTLEIDLHCISQPVLPIGVVLGGSASDAAHFGGIILGQLVALDEHPVGIPIYCDDLRRSPAKSGDDLDCVSDLIPVEAICAGALPEMAQTATNTRKIVDSQFGKSR